MSREQRKPCLFDKANFLSKLTFWWLNPVFGRNPVWVAETSGGYDVAASDEADLLERRLDGCWKTEVRQFCDGGEANLKKAVLSTFKLQWALPGIVLLLAEAMRVVQPMILGVIVGHISGEATLTPVPAYLYGLALVVTLLLQATLTSLLTFVTQRAALRMRTAVEALLYRKVVSLSCEAALMTSRTSVLQLFSASADAFTGAVEHVHYLWVGPLQTAVVAYLLYSQLGPPGLLCLAVVLVIVALHAILEVAAAKLREKSGAWSEQRCQMTAHIVAAMTQIKMCCLESTLTPLITSIRSKELGSLRALAAIQGLVWCMLGVAGRLMLLLAVLVAVETEGSGVGVRAVLTSLALLDVLVWSLHSFPVTALRDWRDMGSKMDTLQTFLLLDEEKEQIKDLRLHRTVSQRSEPYADWTVDVDHMTARWPTVHTGGRKRFQKRRLRDSTSSTKSLLHDSDVEHAFSLKYLSLQVKKGELLAVVGNQLSGKTSLLMTLVGELPYEIGQIAVNGRVVLCSQEPWLFSASLQNNIVFGGTFDATRYDTVLTACSLQQLVEMLPEGDETLIGERGLDLSTGYKAKITLARAVYHNADIYLLDDIFNCVDNQTRQDIMKRCISGALESKTRIIVTRNLQYLKAASRIAVMREGSLFDIGTYEELQSRGVDIREFVATDQSQNQRRGQLEAEEENFRVRLALWRARKAEVKRDDISSYSDLRLLFTFLRGGLFYALLPLVLLLCVGAQGLALAADWTLAAWLSGVAPTHPSPVNTSSAYLPPALPLVSPSVVVMETEPLSLAPQPPRLYGIFVAVATVTALTLALALVELCVSAARRCHGNMLSSLMRAKMGFFLLSSADKVLSSFSHHLSFIDTCVPYLSYLTIQTLLHIVGLMVVMCVVNPWLVIAVVPLLVVMATLQVFGAGTLRGVRLLRETATAPVQSDVSETLQGLETIRAFRRQDFAVEGFDLHLNRLTWARFLALSVLARLTLLGLLTLALFAAGVVFVSVSLVGSINSGLLSLCVTYCVLLLTPSQALLRYAVSLGNNMVSVHGTLAMEREEREAPWFSDKPPPEDWPNRGSITFSNTSLLAGPQGPYLLKDVNVHVKSKEKVGVVGERGSGKYSLVAALSRLGPVQGMLFMDGFDILKIGLHELRKHVSVVPKDPVLFPGTLRSNLDLWGSLSDEQLWGVLDQVGLKDRVGGIRGGLSVEVGMGGETTLFSLGQRQLLCLARALINKTKLVVFEEATDNIESSLNDQIQRILRAKFRDCTVLIVAHRLASVMDCDRIMVFHGGEVREFDTPYNLMTSSNNDTDTPNHFQRLAEQCGRRQQSQLRSLAELSHAQRASASLMLEHAVFMATEQLHASTDDLSTLNFRPGSLAWSNLARLTQSQDSLDKTKSDWAGSRGDVRGSRGDLRDDDGDDDFQEASTLPLRPKATLPSMAPAQKLINKRRMSPNRGRRGGGGGVSRGEEGEEEGGEGMPLMSYDAPPSSRSRTSAEGRDEGGEREKRGSGERERERTYRPNNSNSKNVRGGGGNSSVESSPMVQYSSSPSRPRVLSSTNQNAAERRVLETSIDTPSNPRRPSQDSAPRRPSNDSAPRRPSNDSAPRSPLSHAAPSSPSSPPPHAASAAPPGRIKGRSETGRGRQVGRVGYPVSQGPRVVSGMYSPPGKDKKEDTERIIYC